MKTLQSRIKVGVVFFSIFYSILFASVVFSQESEDDGVNRIYAVDHPHNQLWVNDNLYVMPITLSVYTFNLKTRKKTKVNRYALRKGQSVTFQKIIRNRQAIINEVIIYQ